MSIRFTPFEPLRVAPNLDESALTSQPATEPTTTDALSVPSANTRAPPINDAPGDLSPAGRRHDNDHVDINKIDVMPTTEELYSNRPVYLPVSNPSTWHKQGLQGLVDRWFRLLREDTIGLLKDAARSRLHLSDKPAPHHRTAQLQVYENVHIDPYIAFDPCGGLVFCILFKQPQELWNKNALERQEWWVKNKGFEPDSLVCILDTSRSPIFCQVGAYSDKSPLKSDYSSSKVRIVLRPIDQSPRYIHRLLDWARDEEKHRVFVLLKYPFFQTWNSVPHLRALQGMSSSPEPLLSGLLEPSRLPQPPLVRPPAYSLRSGFRFNLSQVLRGANAAQLDVASPFDMSSLEANSDLDPGQCHALVHALTHRVALIQGPPGTGKSFTGVAIIKTLLNSTTSSDLGPILVVSYKNQALDGLLEKLVEAGVKGIIRVGAQSKSEILAPLNLNKQVRGAKRSESDLQELKRLDGKVYAAGKNINPDLDQLPESDYDRRIIAGRVEERLEDWKEARDNWGNVWNRHSVNILQGAQVVGVTASGLAGKRKWFEKINARVVVFEEAGSMPESHALTSIIPSIEHCILIGDHLQLRPKANRWEFETLNLADAQFGYDVSLLERLANSGIPLVTLTTQYRMYPDISRISRGILYPMVKDAAQVHQHPPVAGMRERVFWFDHQAPETEDDSNPDVTAVFKPKINRFEVEMVAGLVKHLLSQDDVEPDDIAVITPYAAQASVLQQRLSELGAVEALFEQEERHDILLGDGVDQPQLLPKRSIGALRVASVDSFQGEEENIVILSLVRSSNGNEIGFLKSENRANVALTRARNGMYIFGNCKTLQASPYWSKVISMLQETDSVGRSLDMECPRHPHRSIRITRPADFDDLSPQGGCDEICGKGLPCGHACQDPCHSDFCHGRATCKAPCPQILPCGHPCREACGSTCTLVCKDRVIDRIITLPCGHDAPLGLECGRYPHILCVQEVSVTLPDCGHTVRLPCFQQDQPPVCTNACGRLLDCGHRCAVQCHKHDICPPCQVPCSLQCQHQSCSKLCSDICFPCISPECTPSLPSGIRIFSLNARRQYLELAAKALHEVQHLRQTVEAVPQDERARLSKPTTLHADAALEKHIRPIVRRSARYAALAAVRRAVSTLHQTLAQTEPALQSACGGTLNLQEALLTAHLLTRLDVAMVSDFLLLRSRAGTTSGARTLDFAECRTHCAALYDQACARALPRLALHADVAWAQWALLEGTAADEAHIRLDRANDVLMADGSEVWLDPSEGMGLMEDVMAAEGGEVKLGGFLVGVEREVSGRRCGWRSCASGHFFLGGSGDSKCPECGGEGSGRDEDEDVQMGG